MSVQTDAAIAAAAPRPARVLHLLAYPEDVGGILPTIRDLQSAETEAARHDGGAFRHAAWVHTRYVERRSPALEYRFTSMDAREPARPGNLGRGIRDLWRLLRDEKFDLLHSHDRHGQAVGFILSRLSGLPLVVTAHVYSGKRWVYRNLRRIPGVSPVFLTRHMAAYYGCADDARVAVIPDSCPDRLFERPLDGPRREFTPERPLRLLGLGLFHPWKNWNVLIEGVGMLGRDERARVRLVLRGKPSHVTSSVRYAEEMHGAVASLGLAESVSVLPFTDQPEDEIARCDWFVLASIMEPCSVALGEAMALGKPGLVSRSGGNVELVDEGVTGRFIDPHNPADVAAKIREILDGTPGTRPDPEAVRAAVRFRLASAVSRQYRTLYRKALAGRPAAHDG